MILSRWAKPAKRSSHSSQSPFITKRRLIRAGIPQFGLVAEDVEKVNPELVVRDAEGKVNTVRYEQINTMLLNEFLKEHRSVEMQEQKLRAQEVINAELKSAIAQQQKAMEAVMAQLKHQVEQIQQVAAQVEMNKPDAQVAVNGR